MAADADAATLAFGKAYGDSVSVTVVEPPEGSFLVCTLGDCGTKGGLYIQHDAPAIGCTSGFVGMAKSGSGSYSHRVLTAGHCINYAGGPSNTQNWHNQAGTQVWGKNNSMDHFLYDMTNDVPGRTCPNAKTVCIYNDLGYFNVGSTPPTEWNRYFWGGSPGWIDINARTGKTNQLVGQVVWRNGRTSGLDAGTIVAKPTVVVITGSDCVDIDWYCKNYNSIKLDLVSDHGDSGSGFFRLFAGPYGDALGMLSYGTPGYTYYYSWDQQFFADLSMTQTRTILPCITASCPL